MSQLDSGRTVQVEPTTAGTAKVRVSRLLLLFAAAVPALVPLWMILHYGMDMPYWDQWFPDMAGIYIKAAQHTLSFSDFAAQHNEHRILIPRLIYFAMNRLTHWNTIVEMFAGWVAVVLTSLGVLRLIRLTGGEEPADGLRRQDLLLWLLCNVVIFSTAQAENWLWGIGLVNFLPALLLVTSLIIAIHPRWTIWMRVCGVILCSAAAMYSAGLGFACWPLAGIVLAWSASPRELKAKAIPLLILIAAFAICTGLYFVHYLKPPPWPGQNLPMTAGTLLRFFLAFLGNSFAELFGGSSTVVAVLFGVLLCGLVIAAGIYFARAWRTRHDIDLCRRMLPWFALAGYAGFAAALGAAPRVRSGIEQAIASRYTSFSLYVIVGLIVLASIILADLRRRGVMAARIRIGIGWGLTAALALATALTLPRGLRDASIWQSTRMREKGALLLGLVVPDNPMLSSSIPNPSESLPLAQQLSALGYLRPRLIHSANATLLETAGTTPFAVGAITAMVQPEPGTLICAGWAQLTVTGRAANAVFITCDNERGEPMIIATALTGVEWPGVVPARPDSWQGWFARIPPARLPAGLPLLRFSAWALDTQTAQACRIDTVTIGE